MIIDKFEITGFWGRAVVKGKVHTDVTIFIGDNGTGKTTLINLLVAALQVDVERLEAIPFNTIKIYLRRTTGRGRGPSILITRQEKDVPYSIFEYEVQSEKFRIFCDVRRRRRYGRERVLFALPRSRRNYEKLKEVLDGLVEISWISVYRHSPIEIRDEERHRFNVDRRLDQLTTDFSKFQLKLERLIRERSQQFQKDVMQSLLYSKELDDLSNFDTIRRKINLGAEQEDDLIRAFQELGIIGKEQQIKLHYEVIRKAIQNIKDALETKEKPITLSDISPLPFATRTQRIVELLRSAEEDKEAIRRPVITFLEVLHGFVKTKEFSIDKESGELNVKLKIGRRKEPLELFDLSSGEKQLLIQMLEVLLQEQHSMIFLADEPELSLHVKWQVKLLPALRNLNPNSQIIVATHSPDIVSDFKKNVINMEDIVRNAV